MIHFVVHDEHDSVGVVVVEGVKAGQRLTGWLMTNSVSFTHDSSMWVLTGPLAGTRYSFGVGQTVDFKTSRRFNLNLTGDYRQYLRLGLRNCLALRLMGRHSRGEVPEYVSMGGSWTLRAYPWRSLWGRNLVLGNAELRFPLVDRLVVSLPFGDIDLSAFRGAFFVDGGNAWNGYLVSIVGYQDTASAAVGILAPLPPSPVVAGTVYYWNGNGYSSLAATSVSISTIAPVVSITQTIDGHTVNVSMSLLAGSTSPALASTAATPSTAGNVTRTDVTAAVAPPTTTVVYTVTIDGATVVSLNITVNLKSMDARGVYAAAPSQGS